ncbi:hypothetical protein C8A01DRAFT_20339 [Parachaetomium inaequale]|uniref:DUF6590 domain-containing protein n=1 Tax=Parachaetomium inaequale TaxID=2588326 RepID=A0AAN6P6C3_9PEZI|nr:hypothetical protein C8A01DRAFT_20339 [Parachaetomium inaequale]
MVVIAKDESHSTCVQVSIRTYGGRGLLAEGLNPHKHGIIHEVGTNPRRLDGEPAAGYPPVRAAIFHQDKVMPVESRVDYSKLVRVEHNVPVLIMGEVVQEDFDDVSLAVDECWLHKRH